MQLCLGTLFEPQNVGKLCAIFWMTEVWRLTLLTLFLASGLNYNFDQVRCEIVLEFSAEI